MSDTRKVDALVIGAGPAGIGAAAVLARKGVTTLILDRRSEIGGIPAVYGSGGAPTFVIYTQGRVVHGSAFADYLKKRLDTTRVEVITGCQALGVDVGAMKVFAVSPGLGRFDIEARAVILACGAREMTQMERGWITGSRPAGVLFTKNILDLGREGVTGFGDTVVLGSDLIAFSAAAKLKASGAGSITIADTVKKPQCELAGRLYFRHFARAAYRRCEGAAVVGGMRVESVSYNGCENTGCQTVALSGGLVPNTELAFLGGLSVEAPSRLLKTGSGHSLSEPGWFAAGNILGGFHGAQWCYFNGRRAGRAVAEYLRRQ